MLTIAKPVCIIYSAQAGHGAAVSTFLSIKIGSFSEACFTSVSYILLSNSRKCHLHYKR
jgi:hypothetical protein